MPSQTFAEDGKKPIHKVNQEQESQQPAKASPTDHIVSLQQQLGNRAVQRLLAQRLPIQRDSDSPQELDDETENRINRQRGGGQSLDEGVRGQLESNMGMDFSNVRVHTSSESDTLNHQLGAKAFTTGSDIFFRQGEYDPASSSGQELIAHEMTHVVQQSTGAVSPGSGMTVNAPGDIYEQEADSVAKAVLSAPPSASLQRDPLPAEEEETVQAQDEDELVQAQEEEEELVQAQEEDELVQAQEEEEMIQAQADTESEPEAQSAEASQEQTQMESEAAQTQDLLESTHDSDQETIQMESEEEEMVQAQEEEEELVQAQEFEEEEVMMKRVSD
jgi:hypothetical protein